MERIENYGGGSDLAHRPYGVVVETRPPHALARRGLGIFAQRLYGLTCGSVVAVVVEYDGGYGLDGC